MLLVDDDEDGRELLALYLRGRGLEVVTAADCHDATAALEGCAADVAILDVTLPDGDGLELGAALRSKRAALRLVALSGHTEGDYRSRSDAVGFDAYLVKPVDPGQIFSVIAGPGSNLRAQPA